LNYQHFRKRGTENQFLAEELLPFFQADGKDRGVIGNPTSLRDFFYRLSKNYRRFSTAGRKDRGASFIRQEFSQKMFKIKT